MLQARVNNLRSGWQTMFRVYSAASRVLTGKQTKVAGAVAVETDTMGNRTRGNLCIRAGDINISRPIRAGSAIWLDQRLYNLPDRLQQGHKVPKSQLASHPHGARSGTEIAQRIAVKTVEGRRSRFDGIGGSYATILVTGVVELL